MVACCLGPSMGGNLVEHMFAFQGRPDAGSFLLSARLGPVAAA